MHSLDGTVFPIITGYEVGERVGSGGLGTVYRAVQTSTARTVAIKLLHSVHQDMASSLVNEFKILSTLQHPNLVEVYDYGFLADSRSYLVMEWVEGSPLTREQFLDNEIFDERRFASVLLAIASTLQYIHSQHILHGDIKPDNIFFLLSEDGTPHVKLMDFGLSRHRASSQEGISGTFEYMAPELIREEAAEAPSDLYALGCVAYEIVSGTPPFTADSPTDILRMHLHSEIVRLTGISNILERCVSTLLEKSIPRRYRNALQVCDELTEYLGLERTQAADDSKPALRLPDVSTDKEVSKAVELYADTSTPHRFVRIQAPAGFGKSRLLRLIKAEIQISGGVVATIRSEQFPQPFSSVLSLLKGLHVTDAPPEHREWAGIVGSLFEGMFPGVPPADRTGFDRDGEQLRLFHACASLLVQTSGIDALFIDDIHEADPFTQEFYVSLVAYLHAHTAQRFYVAYAVDPEAVNDTLESLQQDDAFVSLSPQAFTSPQVKNSLKALLGDRISESFVNVIYRQTGGIPGRLEELLSYCYNEGIIEHSTHGWSVHERENLASLFPSSMTDAMRRKIAGLDTEDRQVLGAIACSPVSTSLAALAFVTSESGTALHHRCGRLAQRGLINYRNGLCQVAHQILHDLTGEMDADLAPIHTRYTEWYDTHDEGIVAPEVLAHHHLNSGIRSNALPFLLDAAREKKRLYDFPDALRLFQTALPLLTGDKDDRFEVLKELGSLCNILGRKDEEHEYFEEMLVLAGQSSAPDAKLAEVYRQQTEYYVSMSEFERARKASERALAYYTKAKDTLGQAFCHHKIGYIDYRTRPGDAVIRHYQEALNLYTQGTSPIEEGNVLVDIGLVYYSILKSPEKALDYFARAREAFENSGYRRGLIRAYGNTGAQLYYLGRYKDALENHRQAHAYARQIGDRKMLATSYGSMGQCELALSLYSDALLHLEEELRISMEIRDVYLQELVSENQGELFAFVGEYDRSIACYEKAQALAIRSSNTAGEISTYIDIAGGLIEKREIDKALKLLQKARTMLESVDDVNVLTMWWYRFGMLHLSKSTRQDFDEAYRAFAELGDLADRHAFRSHQILARSYIGLAQMHGGRAKEALEMSSQAIALLQEGSPLYGGSQDILYNHALILRANGKVAESATVIEAAHAQVIAIAENISDVHLYRSFLENVRVNSEIVREYTLIHRADSKSAVSVIREQNLRTLYQVSSKINAVLDLPVLLENIMDSALEALNAERGLIFLVEDDQLTLKVSRNVEKETIQDASEISLSILREVLSGGKPIIIADTSKNDSFRNRHSVVNYKIHSLICVPIRSKDQIIGTVYVDSRSSALKAMTFSDIEAEFVDAFANLAAMAIENARLHAKLQQENLYLKKEVEKRFGFENIVGDSQPMMKLFSETQAAIASDSNVLIFGESGTGKELIAKAIHYNGARHAGHFVAIDCGALPDTLLESELFGYRRGAFTGAFADKLGLIQEAHNGTLFLDEISNTSLAFQAKLLRVLQEGEYRRVGDTETRTADVRIICATNKNLSEEIQQGRFREDLFYRLNVIPINIPPLRDRTSDIPSLVQHFIVRFNEKNGTAWKGATQDFIALLHPQAWRGNVRELENLINRLLAQHQDEVLSSRHLPPEYAAVSGAPPTGGSTEMPISLRPPNRLQTMVEMEREHILYVLQYTKGNKTEAAKILGLKRTTLVEKMKKLGLM